MTDAAPRGAERRFVPFVPGPEWPFPPRRAPFFYGWVVVAVSTVGILASIPGQTMGMAVFTESLMAALGLDRTELSLAYMLGTIGSSFFLTHAGRLYDRLGGRMLMVGSSLALGVTLVYLAEVDRLARALDAVLPAGGTAVPFLLVLVGYLLVRFFGQGVLTSASRNIVMSWFERRRGLVNGVRGVFVSLGFSLAPPVLGFLIVAFQWRGALLVLALVCGLAFALLALLLARDAPEPCGLRPDGDDGGPDAPAPAAPDGVSLEVARRQPVFWIYCLSLSMHALFGTAITFHVVSIFQAAGRSAEEAFGYFLPVALVSTTTNMLTSWASDRAPLRPFLVAMLLAFVIACAGLTRLEDGTGYVLLVVGQGLGGGLWAMLSNIAWVRLFGRLHLGAISGLNMSLIVFFSAVGPALFALGIEYTDSVLLPVLGCAGAFLALAAAALFVPGPRLGRA